MARDLNLSLWEEVRCGISVFNPSRAQNARNYDKLSRSDFFAEVEESIGEYF